MRILTRIRKIPLARKIIRLNKQPGREPADSLKYIIFAHARTGSSVLGDILNVHPKINLAHEPFRGKFLMQSELQVINIGNKKFPVTTEDEFRSALNKIGWKFNGIKHIFGNIDEEFNKILLTKKGMKVIFLQRKNLLQSTVSMLISQDIQRWGGRAEKWRESFDKQVFKPFEIKAIQNRIKSINKKLQYYKQVLTDNNVDFYNMYYEDLFGENLTEEQKLGKVNEIFEFLGVGPLNSPRAIKKIKEFLNPKERKLNSEETYRQIPNHQEIERECGCDETGWLFGKTKPQSNKFNKIQILSPYNCGSNLLFNILKELFQVDKSFKNSGSSFIWKHTANYENFKKIDKDAIIFVMVRNPLSWIKSIEKEPYKIGFERSNKNILDKRIKQTNAINLKDAAHIIGYHENVIQLWNHYYTLYDQIETERTGNVVFVKYEDILFNPIATTKSLTQYIPFKNDINDENFNDRLHSILKNPAKDHGRCKNFAEAVKTNDDEYLFSNYNFFEINKIQAGIKNNIMKKFNYHLPKNNKVNDTNANSYTDTNLIKPIKKYAFVVVKIIKKIITGIDKYSSSPMFYPFVMSKNERKLFDKKLKNSKNYLEFGIGGTTFRALQKSKAKIYSVDSNSDWVNSIRRYKQIRLTEEKRLFLFHANIGPTKEWGYPIDYNKKKLFPAYSANIFDLINKKDIDTVLIDGRFRVACALKTILECCSNENLEILIHDFWNREKYHVVLKYLNAIDRADTLGVFVLKNNIDINSVKKDYEIYKYIAN